MISVCILTKNAARHLAKTLEELQGFSEVVLLDNGSEDETLQIAASYPNVKIHTSPFIGFGPLRNRAASLATNEWILALDSDELLSPALQKELFALKLDEEAVYSIPRHNYYNGKWIKGAGWHPERVVRLYHRKRARYKEVQVHESLITEGKRVVPFSSPILHTPYLSVSDFLQKMELYSTLFAEQNRGKSSSMVKALGHGTFAFFKSYFLQRGFLCGREGLFISLYNAHSAFYKYAKLLER